MKSYFHEIVKYHPAGYKDRIYTFDDWTSISDIGKIFRTGILSADDYIKVEDSYVNTILTVMSETDCHYLTIEYVEAYDDEIVKRMHIPADTRSAFPVISVQSPVSIQCCWQS